MSARFQRLFCAGCLAVALLALPGALREVRLALGGPYALDFGAPVSVAPAIAPAIAPAVAVAAPAIAPATGTGVLAVTLGARPSATVASAARRIERSRVLPVQLRTAAAPGRPVLFRDGLGRPGI